MNVAYEVLRHINELLIFSVNGEEQEYENGKTAYELILRKYTVQGKNLSCELDNVFTKDGKIFIRLTKWIHGPGTVDLDAV